VASHFTLVTALLLCLLGFGVGVFGTLVGAGGGFILTPVLLLLYPNDTPALITAFHHTVGLRRAAALSLGVVFGAQLGAVLSQRLSGRLIQNLLAAGLLLLGVGLVLSVLIVKTGGGGLLHAIRSAGNRGRRATAALLTATKRARPCRQHRRSSRRRSSKASRRA